jgi:hypothetical protein
LAMNEFLNESITTLIPDNSYSPGHQVAARPFVVQSKSQDATLPTFGDVNQVQQLDASVMQSLNLQAKLAIGAPGDKYEQEADTVASQVVQQINLPQAQQKSLQREAMPEEEDEMMMKPLDIQREEIPEEEDELMMKPLMQRQADGGGMASADLEASIAGVRGKGQPLSEGVRGSMEQAFGADFSGVRVHADADSHQLNQAIQARAFTTGQDIFFRQGEYQPDNQGGQELLAHELTHVVQQNGSAVQSKKQT